MKSLMILVFGFSIFMHQSQSVQFLLKHFEIKASTKFFGNNISYNYTSYDEKINGYLINCYSYLILQIEASVMMTILSKAENDKFECKDLLRERRFNVCKLAKAIKSSIFFDSIVTEFTKAASFKISCPFKTGEYSVWNMTLGLPSILPIPRGFYCFETHLIGNTKTQKKMEKYVSIFAKAHLK